MTPDFFVTLGGITLTGLEIPERIPFGVEKNLVLHQLVGGKRVIDDLGAAPIPIEWSGLLFGQNALSRARYLQTQAINGLPLRLTWSELSYTVVVHTFRADFQRAYQIPYSVVLWVVEDNAAPQTSLVAGIDSFIAEDMASANALGDEIGDSELSGLLGGLDTAIAAVSSFASAAQSVINSVLIPLGEVTARVDILLGQASAVIGNVVTIGGLLPNTRAAQRAADVVSQAGAFAQWAKLGQISAVTGRMGANLQSLGGSGKSITVSGANLFRIAEQEYGDATAWTGIARANGLTDPEVAGIKQLSIPRSPDTSGGLLSA